MADVVAQTDEAWLDHAGNFHSSDVHMVERYRLTGADTLEYEARIEDPVVYTRPWTLRVVLYRVKQPGARIIEDECLGGCERCPAPHFAVQTPEPSEIRLLTLAAAGMPGGCPRRVQKSRDRAATLRDMWKTSMARRAAASVLGILILSAGACAHHGAAAYDVDREIVVTGTVGEWRWTNPHTRIHLSVRRADGSLELWDGEGPPLTWAQQRGWSNATLRTGETVSLVLYPSRSAPHAGLVKRIERASGEIPVSRPWLDDRPSR